MGAEAVTAEVLFAAQVAAAEVAGKALSLPETGDTDPDSVRRLLAPCWQAGLT